MKGIIFDIREFTVHDGPGSRITVFLKGCPLRCKWCHNPEGLRTERQLMYRDALCTHCGTCFRPCRHPECKPFGRCIHACPNGCLDIAGEEIAPQQLAQLLHRRGEMVKGMGGGITFSGGEPMFQPDFVLELAGYLPDFHKAVQTSGYADMKTYQKVVNAVDYVMQDIKLADPQNHMKYTGVSNQWVLKNIEWLKSSGKEFVFRIPLIPGITDTKTNLESIAKITEDFPTELLPYNSLAGAKYAMLGMEYPLSSEGNRCEDFTRFFKNARLI